MTQKPPHRLKALFSGKRLPAGFTLLELMTVVVLVGVLALVAVPVATLAMRENRSASAAQSIALMYQVARSRAIGRGVPVLVRFTDGRFEVREPVAPDGGTLVSVTSCSVPVDLWLNPGDSELIDSFELLGQSPYKLVRVEFSAYVADSFGAATQSVISSGTAADVCFTPSGRMMYREGTVAFGAEARTLAIRVGQVDDGVEVGTSRTVFVLPNGVARVAAKAGS